MHSACAVLYCHLWPVRLYNIFPLCLINSTTSVKIYIYIRHKICSIATTFVQNIYSSEEKIIHRDTINVHGTSYKEPVILGRFYSKWPFSRYFRKNTQISNVMKILPVGAELFDADRRSGRIDEAKSVFIRNLTINRTQDLNM